jgi:hypothetical protein
MTLRCWRIALSITRPVDLPGQRLQPPPSGAIINRRG